MKYYSKKIITLMLTSGLSLTTMGCTNVKSVDNSEITMEYIEEDESELIDEAIFEEEYEGESIVFLQDNAVRAIKDTEIIDINGEIIGYLPKDEELKVNMKYTDLYEVKYNDKMGYVKNTDVIEDYITRPQDTYISVAYINDDTSIYSDTYESNIVKDLSKYESAYIYYEIGDYCYVMSDNNIGFVKKDKLNILDGTFVIVDISNQHLDLYQNNEIVMSSPVVTGKDKKTPTKIGIHEVYDTRGNRDLIGDNGSRHYVDVMNKFYKGQGLHDAEYDIHYDESGNVIKKHGWRDLSEFGGYTFLEHGSNGCVNMPHDEALELNEYVDIGTKVLVKR